MSSSVVHDVIITGAGPVGLFLACELALAGCSVVILEKTEHAHSLLKALPFGMRGLSAPTIEALYRRDLLKELELHKHLKNPHKAAVSAEGARRQAGHFAGIPFHDGDIDRSGWAYRLPGSTDASLISEIQELESILSRRAEALGVAVKRGFAVTGFQQSEGGVMVQSNEHSFAGKWLVGCDGARSTVRKLGGFEFAGTEPEFTGYTTQIDVANPDALGSGRNVTEKGMYFQSQPGYVLIQDFDGGAFHRSGLPVTREHIQEVLRRIVGVDITLKALHVATTWTDQARQATTYRHGRILLAGDAAHIHSPLGGQGLNLGLGDAMNLGWKLAATIRGNAPEGLLDSYQAERHPLGARVLDWSRAQVAIMRPDSPARALHAILRDLINTRDGATYMARRVWGVDMHYSLGNEPSEHSLIGNSVPNFEFEDGACIGELMHRGQGVLIDFNRHAALKDFSSAYSNRIIHVSGPVKESFGLSAALIRPDGFIAWASDGEPDLSELRKAATRWFVADTGAEKFPD